MGTWACQGLSTVYKGLVPEHLKQQAPSMMSAKELDKNLRFREEYVS